jgi:Zn-dependent protease with chaperone function
MSNGSFQPNPPALAVNDLAAAYQPRRIWAAVASISWNLFIAAMFLSGGGAWTLYHRLAAFTDQHGLSHRLTAPIYLAILFGGYSLLNFPIELWFGYLEERQFGLAKDGVRAWARDWLIGVLPHGLMFCVGCTAVLTAQANFHRAWLPGFSFILLILFIGTSHRSLSLLPRALFQIEPIDWAHGQRLQELVGPANRLPPMFVFSAPHLRDFSGGLIGLGDRQAMLLSRSTLTAASDAVLRFVLLHDLGHKRYHHLLLATLTGWAWATLGLCASQWVIGRASPESIGHPPYLAWLALLFSLWMAAGEPLLAYLGRRLEYQADRFYLRHGGTLTEMRAALEELSHRNLARTEGLCRRHTIFHPLPSVWNRLHAAGQFIESLAERNL